MALSIDYDSPAALKSFLEERGLAMQKKFGQNFLINGQARKKLIDSLEIEKGTTVWEIGPGLGAMTSEILDRGAELTAFEIDHGFAAALGELFGDRSNFKLVEGDVLKTWKTVSERPARLFGNLPYNIAATIFADLICAGVRFDKSVITVQKEVAQRMNAKPGTDDYSSFSVLCQWAYDVTPLMDLGGGSFWPRPNVDSRAVKFVKKELFPQCKDAAFFAKMQRALFVSRRKTIKNNLTTFLSDSAKAETALKKAEIDPKVRAETLDISTLLRLSDAVGEIL
ncbi:MAG: ribosomal RNA small subunit methyltransferase A [Spirochaetaceae bacterium]|nr:ribosomal RNA small subunit methyltransferase A [Spirochaetaceae bacterium]